MLLNKLAQIREEKDAEDRGFTLIELLVVVVIIGILIAIAIPLYLNYQKGAKDKSAQSDLRAAVSALNQCFTDNNNFYPASISITTGNSYYLPSASGCSSDKLNISSGTTFTYTASPASCTDTSCTGFVLKAANSGGNRNDLTANGKYYSYDSTAGGAVN